MSQQRRLSPWRVLLAIILLAGIGVGSVSGMQRWRASQSQASSEPWFASYVDVTATPTFAFEQMGKTDYSDVMLAFVVASPTDACTPTWGGAYTLEQANSSLDLERRIERLRQQGGNVAVSFGGLINNELAVGCTDEDKLLRAYSDVVGRYKIDTIDLDLEKEGLVNQEAAARRARVIAKLQQQRRDAGKNLAVWVTLPVAPQGLTQDGTNAVAALLAAKVDLAGVNVMTMDYGSSRAENQSMKDASTAALTQTHRQLDALYKRAHLPLNSATLWSKIGATPMIGQNDVAEEVFDLTDAQGLNAFARKHNIGRMSMWSANRDVPCSDNYVNLKIVSTSCSGVEQNQYDFAVTLSNGFTGSMARSSGKATASDPNANKQKADDPKTSPYQIWSPKGAYLKGTKVVWHQNVYEAKWWTEGEVPDSPVLQSWETPWELVGPVLPGEKPIKQATLPEGSYPEWSGTTGYNTGDRVLFEKIPYQAKWWTQGSSPAAASANADASPWTPLTQAQINAILDEEKKN